MLRDIEKTVAETIFMTAHLENLAIVETTTSCDCPDKAHEGQRAVVIVGITPDGGMIPLAQLFPEGFNPAIGLHPPRMGDDRYRPNRQEIVEGRSAGTLLIAKEAAAQARAQGTNLVEAIKESLRELGPEHLQRVLRAMGVSEVGTDGVVFDGTEGAVFPPGVYSKTRGEG